MENSTVKVNGTVIMDNFMKVSLLRAENKDSEGTRLNQETFTKVLSRMENPRVRDS